MRTLRHLHLVGAAGSNLRTAEFNGVEHLVVPVVALVEGVVWAMNSELPEFVPAEELAFTPQQWNGRHCFAGHPVEAGVAVTANTPRKLAESFGIVFQASSAERILSTRRLELEAWLDPERAKLIGPAAISVIDRLRAGQLVEVSVGCFIDREETAGVYNGKDYNGVWRDIVSDHLAFLGADQTGACSIEAGCGAPRAAVRHLVTQKGIIRAGETMPSTPQPSTPQPGPGTPLPAPTPSTPTPAPTPAPPAPPSTPPSRNLLQRVLDVFRAEKAQPGQSDRDLRRLLDSALRAVEPGYQGVDEVYPADNVVIYSAFPADKWLTLRRGYTQSGDTVSLLDNREEVEPVVSYEPVTAAAAATAVSKPVAAATCGCHAKTPEVPVAAQTTTPQGEETMKETTKQLIARSAGKFTDADAAWLDNVPVERHDSLLGTTPTPAPVETPAPVAAAAKPEKTAQQIEDEYLAAAPQSIRDLVTANRAAEAKRRTTLVTQMKAAQSEYTEEELNAMPIGQLDRLSRALLSVPSASDEDDSTRIIREDLDVDFSGRGVVPEITRAAGEKDPYQNPPDPWVKQLEARKAK